MNLVLLGPPGSGKSTVAKPLVERHGLTLIATGQRLRDEMAARTPIGLEVEPLLERGEFAPDELMARLIRDVLGKLAPDQGFLMDGYPRTQFQAVTLEQLLAGLGRSLTAVINLEVPDAEVIRRMSGRRTCIIPGEAPWPIHIEDEAAVAQCQARGGTLTQRDDDSPELVRQRLAVYHERTQPLISFYRERGRLLVIDASAPPDTVIERATAALAPLVR
ncbi:nucleoside monophosphate kinase [Chloroflexia bacterium SDU3-3]|nr:nucleoside monophosphate kinase [Chloroflexia bacterium SDU3-3]